MKTTGSSRSSSSSTPSKSLSLRPSTLESGTSSPSYSSRLGKAQILLLKRYCTRSMRRRVGPCRARRREKRVTSRSGERTSLPVPEGVDGSVEGEAEAEGFAPLVERDLVKRSDDLSVGGSCRWSPACSSVARGQRREGGGQRGEGKRAHEDELLALHDRDPAGGLGSLRGCHRIGMSPSAVGGPGGEGRTFVDDDDVKFKLVEASTASTAKDANLRCQSPEADKAARGIRRTRASSRARPWPSTRPHSRRRPASS